MRLARLLDGHHAFDVVNAGRQVFERAHHGLLLQHQRLTHNGGGAKYQNPLKGFCRVAAKRDSTPTLRSNVFALFSLVKTSVLGLVPVFSGSVAVLKGNPIYR
ncbi:hypothetical protein [Polaromonas sp.]|uniref:hypothetical protein n=1 Tax=Polaromonas sp. TaxID=1869339 RepID=UPI002D1FABB0|nr:hypothetical protein [Polaromonas sp.]